MTRRVWSLRQGRLRSIRGYPGAADTVRGSPTVLAGASYINLPKSNHHARRHWWKIEWYGDNPEDVGAAEKFFGGEGCRFIIRKVALSETAPGRLYINCFLTGWKWDISVHTNTSMLQQPQHQKKENSKNSSPFIGLKWNNDVNILWSLNHKDVERIP